MVDITYHPVYGFEHVSAMLGLPKPEPPVSTIECSECRGHARDYETMTECPSCCGTGYFTVRPTAPRKPAVIAMTARTASEATA